MDSKPKLTKQGIKDLNHYGPKPARIVAEAPASTHDEAVTANPPPAIAEKKPDAPASVGA